MFLWVNKNPWVDTHTRIDLVHVDMRVSEPLGSTRWNLCTSWNWCIDKPLWSTRWNELHLDWVFPSTIRSKAGDWPIAAPLAPPVAANPGSRAVASSASYAPLARARRSFGAILAISACLSPAHAAGRGAKSPACDNKQRSFNLPLALLLEWSAYLLRQGAGYIKSQIIRVTRWLAS